MPLLMTINFAQKSKIDPVIAVKQSCEEKDFCPSYAVARHECAIANDVEKCISIKMNGIETARCNSTGSSEMIDKINPNLFVCFVEKTAISAKSLFYKN